MPESDDLLICVTCGTQFDEFDRSILKTCKICDDPRQFVPPSGQAWTTMAEIRKKYKNKIIQDSHEERMWNIITEPKFGIGQRCFLLCTPAGNILWETVALLDDEVIDFINSKGGLKAIIISHPHWYTTNVDWAKTFNCPVYTHIDDREWLCRAKDDETIRRFITGATEEVLGAVTAIKVGGHFDGILVLLWEEKLYTADAIAIVASGLYHKDRPPGTTSFAFMWSYPNMIPLSPTSIHNIWKALKPFEFDTCHSGFENVSIRNDKDVKARVLESMKIQVKAMGHLQHALLDETLA